MQQVYLIHGNMEEAVNSCRYELQRKLLPGGEEDGEIIDIRPPGNMPLKLERAVTDIIQELGTVSLIAEARRVVVVYNLYDFRTEQRGSVRQAKKEKAGKKDHVAELEHYLTNVLPTTENTIVFVFDEDDEKNRRVAKTSAMYQLVKRIGQVHEFNEKRIDWQLDETLMARNLYGSLALIRDWTDRGGNSAYRLTLTLNGFLQLLLQARLQAEAQRDGINTNNLFAGMRPSLATVPNFKASKMRALAGQIPLPRIHSALRRLNDAQKSFFPSGEELVVHDALEQIEVMLMELFAPNV